MDDRVDGSDACNDERSQIDRAAEHLVFEAGDACHDAILLFGL